jgi:hypothetical protein
MNRQQRQQILQRIWLDMGVTQEGLGRGVAHPPLHQEQRIPHHEAPRRESVAQRVQRQAGVDRRQEPPHTLSEDIGIEPPRAIRHRAEHESGLRRLAEHEGDRPRDAGIGDHPRLAVLRQPGSTIGEGLPLDPHLAAVRITPQEILQLPPPQLEEDSRYHQAIERPLHR